MDKIVIEGGKKLEGSVRIAGAKNAALPMLAATLLADGKHVIKNVPYLRDIKTTFDLLGTLGSRSERVEPKPPSKRRGSTAMTADTGIVTVRTPKKTGYTAPYELVKTMRASCLVLGPLIARCGRAEVSLPGGCAIGARPINLHLKAFEQMGAKIKIENGYVAAIAPRGGLKGAKVYFDIVSVTGTENVLMAAALADGVTVIENAAREPEVVALANQLAAMGAKISGAGEPEIIVTGVDKLHPAESTVIPDRIETGTYLVAGAVTGGEITTLGCVPDHCAPTIMKLREAGAKITESDNSITIKAGKHLKAVDVKTLPHPGFPTDMQAQMMAAMCVADGLSVITETVFENRFLHAAELNRMGAEIKIEGSMAVVQGGRKLMGAQVMATDLRASASLVIAGLVAKGETLIDRVYHLDRGYERMEDKLSALGAKIGRIK